MHWSDQRSLPFVSRRQSQNEARAPRNARKAVFSLPSWATTSRGSECCPRTRRFSPPRRQASPHRRRGPPRSRNRQRTRHHEAHNPRPKQTHHARFVLQAHSATAPPRHQSLRTITTDLGTRKSARHAPAKGTARRRRTLPNSDRKQKPHPGPAPACGRPLRRQCDGAARGGRRMKAVARPAAAGSSIAATRAPDCRH